MRYQISTMSKLHSYFNIKRKLDINANNESETVTKKQRDNKYDEVKRNRSFQDKWSEEFPWVTYEKDQMLICTLCMKFPNLSGGMACSFVSGSTSFHKATLKSHDQAVKHLSCVKHAR